MTYNRYFAIIIPASGGYMERKLLYKNNLKKSSIPLLYSKLLRMDTKDLIDIFLDYKVDKNIIKYIYHILKIRNEYGLNVYEYLKKIDYTFAISLLESKDYFYEHKKYFLCLYPLIYHLGTKEYDTFFNNANIDIELKKFAILIKNFSPNAVNIINNIKDKKLRLYFYKVQVNKRNIFELFNSENRFLGSLYEEFIKENSTLYYQTIKKGNIKKLLYDALFKYKNENLLNDILKIKSISKEDIKKYADQGFIIKAVNNYSPKNPIAFEFVNQNYALVLSYIENLSKVIDILYATDEGMQLYLDKSKIKNSLNKLNVDKINKILNNSCYSKTLKTYLVNENLDKLTKFYQKFDMKYLFKNYKFIFDFENLCFNLFNSGSYDKDIIKYLNKLCLDSYFTKEEYVITFIKASPLFFENLIKQTDFSNFSFYGKQKLNDIKEIALKKVFEIYHDDILSEYKMVNSDTLIEILYNEKENNIIKDLIYEILIPCEEDRISIKPITGVYGYDVALKYYNVLKKFLIKINFDKKLFIQYGLNDATVIYIMAKIIEFNEFDNFIKFYNFLIKNYFNSVNEAQNVENLCNSLLNYYEYKDLFSNLDYNNLNDGDIKNIIFLLNDKKHFIETKPHSLIELDNLIKESNRKIRETVNKSKSIIELNQIFSYVTALENSKLDILISNVGGITGLETLKADNIQNEKLLYYIDEIIDIINIRLGFSTNEKALKFILNKILSEEDNPIKDVYTNIQKISDMIRNVFENEANYNLTRLSNAEDLVNEELTKKYGVKTYDFSKVNYCLYAHVKSFTEDIESIVNGISDGNKNYISLSAISYLGQRYYYNFADEVFLYDEIPSGSYICSSMSNMSSNTYLSKNSYCNKTLFSSQRGILETSVADKHNSETLLYRNGLKPVAIALVGGAKPTFTELKYAKKYNLSFVITQKLNEYIDRPINYFEKETIKFSYKKDNIYDDLLNLINYRSDDHYTGRQIMIIADIHALLEPTIALLAYAKANCIKEIYSLGDNITVGPNPKEVLELLEKYNVQSIEGNSESYFLNDYEAFTYFDDERRNNCDWTLDKIKSRVNDLKYYPISREITIGDQNIGLIHFGNDIRWDYNSHSTWSFQGNVKEERAKQFLYTNSLQSKEDMQKIITTLGPDHPHSKIILKAMNNPMLSGKKITDFDHIFQGHVHFEYEDILNNTLIHTIKMVCQSDLAYAVILKERKDGNFDIEPLMLPFNKESMMGKIFSSDMPSKSKALLYTK